MFIKHSEKPLAPPGSRYLQTERGMSGESEQAALGATGVLVPTTGVRRTQGDEGLGGAGW